MKLQERSFHYERLLARTYRAVRDGSVLTGCCGKSSWGEENWEKLVSDIHAFLSQLRRSEG